MTVSSSTNKVSFSGNGTLTTFAYSFKIFDQDDLTVILRAANGTETTQTITTHYTVTGVGSASGGNVVFGTAPASGVTVVVIREQPLTQGLDLVPNDPFPAQSLEESLDKLTFMAQKHEEELSRAIKGSRTNVITNSEFTVSATDRANKVFAFDGSGNLSVTQELGTFKGNWAASTAYVPRDIVKDTSTNNIFIINTTHTSSGSQPLTTNANSAKYDLIVDAASSTTAQTASASSATAAASSATAAASSATASATAKTASETAKTASETAQAASEAALDSFDDRYLGAKSTSGGNPTQDNDGNALIDGALFFDTTNNVLMVYNLGTTTWLRTTPTSSDQTAINAVNADASDIGTVAGISSNVTTVAGVSANVTSVAAVASLITSDFVSDLNTLATTDIISDLNTLATADIVSDLNTLATSDIVSDLNTLATADIVSDLNTLATTDIVSDLNTLATTDIVTDLNLLATSAIVEDLNLLATSTVIADMATLAGAGANPNISSLAVSGNITLGDSNKAIFGAGSDLQIFHDGSNSFINNTVTGALSLKSDDINLMSSASETMATFVENGAVTLYHDNAAKLATTATGIDVTGAVTADGLTVDGDVSVTGDTFTITSSAQDDPVLLIQNTTNDSNSARLKFNKDRGAAAQDGDDIADIIFAGENDAQQAVTYAAVRVEAADVSDGSEDGTIAFQSMKAGTLSDSLKIDSSGNVGIGTSSPNSFADLHVVDTSDTRIWVEATSGDTLELHAGTGAGVYNRSNSHLILGTNNTERLRITSDGNLLVGKTSTNNLTTTAGHVFYGNGEAFITRAGTPLYLGRTGSDGSIVNFYKDGSTVGSIGSVSGNTFFANSTTGGFKFGTSSGSTIVDPVNETGAVEDATHDLGSSGGRWRNLYLSSGVFLGGTGSANKLDDYEEGTFTPTFGDGNGTTQAVTGAAGRYTKIGQRVFVEATFVRNNVTGTDGNLRVGNLPFTSSSNSSATNIVGHMWIDNGGPSANGGDEVGAAYLGGGSTSVLGVKSTTSAQQANVRYFQYSQVINSRPVSIALVYRTDS